MGRLLGQGSTELTDDMGDSASEFVLRTESRRMASSLLRRCSERPSAIFRSEGDDPLPDPFTSPSAIEAGTTDGEVDRLALRRAFSLVFLFSSSSS